MTDDRREDVRLIVQAVLVGVLALSLLVSALSLVTASEARDQNKRSFCVIAASGQVIGEFGRLVLAQTEGDPSLDALDQRVKDLDDAIAGVCPDPQGEP